ncbi:hypothetical protein K435DRAFT_839610 [Dendrothele bispora CBS 962.96]|uniref:Uncharacterized protein n=1 Tax=Dendrothele bispora (strain CBS 962.96) TaxID=1314807 RepID=A0A4S8LZG4_DENBC|nr:hypothetical protein K435DRAFT_839610 [Dendrothele bispora CBS 962.96]
MQKPTKYLKIPLLLFFVMFCLLKKCSGYQINPPRSNRAYTHHAPSVSSVQLPFGPHGHSHCVVPEDIHSTTVIGSTNASTVLPYIPGKYPSGNYMTAKGNLILFAPRNPASNRLFHVW